MVFGSDTVNSIQKKHAYHYIKCAYSVIEMVQCLVTGEYQCDAKKVQLVLMNEEKFLRSSDK